MAVNTHVSCMFQQTPPHKGWRLKTPSHLIGLTWWFTSLRQHYQYLGDSAKPSFFYSRRPSQNQFLYEFTEPSKFLPGPKKKKDLCKRFPNTIPGKDLHFFFIKKNQFYFPSKSQTVCFGTNRNLSFVLSVIFLNLVLHFIHILQLLPSILGNGRVHPLFEHRR